jgi:hypothetical protein
MFTKVNYDFTKPIYAVTQGLNTLLALIIEESIIS